jgi:hypothetical protein
MTAFKPQQRHLTIRGRTFHFVSYEAQPANVARGQPGAPSMWYLMLEGRRCPALAYDPKQSLTDLDEALQAWAEGNALGEERALPVEASQASPPAVRRTSNWWGPS